MSNLAKSVYDMHILASNMQDNLRSETVEEQRTWAKRRGGGKQGGEGQERDGQNRKASRGAHRTDHRGWSQEKLIRPERRGLTLTKYHIFKEESPSTFDL